MSEDIKSQLAKIYPGVLATPESAASKHPPYNYLSIQESYAKFCQEVAGRDFSDQRGTAISLLEVNFPKLIGLKLAAPRKRAKASRVLNLLRSGTFSESAYTHERDRITTLFWITDVICAADAIHKNAHPTIAGDEVYVKHYDKAGASVKLVFVEATYAGQRVVSTSFMTEPEKLD
jgi:hypothetical protein